MHLKKLLPFLLAVMVMPFLAKAQVTTSTITGTVLSAKNEPLEGATITATHTPSGTVYTTVVKKGGVYTLPSLRIGGPYHIVVTSAGKQDQTIDDVTLSLGEPYNLNVVMQDRTTDLTAVVVTATATRTARDKTGASTNINSRLLTTLPTISRSITDFTRLTPQAGANNGFAGRDGRNNNITVDGANLNNNFGLNTDPLPGGGVNPISLDALEEVSINIAPFDVRQANFTGANISAVTKSGTNTFKGSAYMYYKDQDFNGLKVKNVTLPDLQKSYGKIFGATFGGPIIKNKLFFFGAYEYEERSAILNYYTPAGGSGSGNLSAVPSDSLKKVSDYLKSKYSFDPGAYDNFNTGVPLKNHKILGKIDWNISKAHKLTLKYSELVSTGSSLPSQSGSINGANSTGIVTYGPKFSPTAMAFGGTIYSTEDITRSGSFELNSNFKSKFANQFLATFTKIETNKDHPGARFPFVDILGPNAGDKTNYISFGNEPFNGNYNVVQNDVLTITDNFTYFAGRHTVTAGGSYEYQKVGNGFMAGSQGYYVFGSIDDFVNNRAPKLFSQTYSLIPGQDQVISAELKIGQLGLYAQDEFQVNDKLKITAGVRFDKPVYPEQPLENKAISSLVLSDNKGGTTTYTTGRWPKAAPYWSPRVGFRWNIPEEKLVIRGGTGLFTGRIPFVYLTNIPTNSAMYQFGALITQTAQLGNFLFNPDPHAYNPFYNNALNPAQFPTTAGAVVPTGAYALTAKNFKFPQVWRTNLAVDKQLGKGFSLTLETILTKDINAVYMFNGNQKAADSVIVIGSSTRPRYTTTAGRKLNAASGNAIVLANTKKGGSATFTAQINKAFAKGFYAMAAYTYTGAWDVTANPGSQANSVWSVNATGNTQNDIELSTSSFATPHRIIASVSYRKEYIKHLATSLAVFYEGSSQGTMSFIYNGDINNDGNSADLMYIPKDASEIRFVNLAASGVTPAFTAQQQSDAFFKYVAQDKYLSKHMGQVAERNGARLPFFHRVDLKLAQDIFTNFGGRKNTLQVTADMFNALNFINKNWGVRQLTVVNNPLRLVSVTNGQPNFTMATYVPNGETVGKLVDKTFVNNYSTTSTWSMQLGFRYIF